MFLTPGSRVGGGPGGRREGGFRSGTTLLFYQAAAPLGWTKLTSQNDKALRVVSGSGGVSGGTNAFSTVMAQSVVGSSSLSIAQLPSHGHNPNLGLSFITWYNATGHNYPLPNGAASLEVEVSGGVPASTGSGSTHNHTITMAMQYIDVILASKN